MKSEKLETWQFGVDNDFLVDLVLKGEKKATTSIYNGEKPPKVGELSILSFSNGRKACVLETKKIIITEFKNITSDLAQLEGEGDKSLEYFQKIHYSYFKSIDPSFNENTKVIFEIFEVVSK